MSPLPIDGMNSQSARPLKTYPWEFFLASMTRDVHLIYPDIRTVRHIMFSPSTPEEVVSHCQARLQKESWRAVQEMNPPLKAPYPITSRMLVLGGELDGTVHPDAVIKTAQSYGAECHIFEGMGHNLMFGSS